jgi:hypothetical protein
LFYPRLALDICNSATPQAMARDKVVLEHLLEALTAIDLYYLRKNPGTPSIYRAGVSYEVPPDDGTDDDWRDIPTVIKLGKGDCDDFACWRAAELRLQGVAARAVADILYDPIITKRLNRSADKPFFSVHILVQLPDGRREDPSRALGMK